MPYSPHEHHFLNGVPCLDFANTVVWRSWPEKRIDRIATAGDLALWAKAAKLPPPRMALAPAITMREAVDRYFRGKDQGAWAELVSLYAAALAEPRCGFAEAILHSAMALAFSPQALRVKVCGNCGWLFIDRTRNRNKRWCIAQICGARTRSSRYYRRKSAKRR